MGVEDRVIWTAMISDEALAQGIKEGNRHHLALLVERHHSPLIGFLYRMTDGDQTLAEDLAQESFLKVMHAIDQFQHPRPFKPWLYQIATNLVRDHYKRADTRRAIGMSEEVELTGDDEPLPEDMLVLDAEVQQVVVALRSLPDHQRETVTLRYYQGLSLGEIAEALDVPVGTVKSRLSLGLGRLREILMEREL
jgi:RNA polymerase sigma-70 factor, ECF subfamily